MCGCVDELWAPPSVRPGHLVGALPQPAGTPERELPLPPPCCPVGLLLQEARSTVLPRLPAPAGARLPSPGQLEGRRDRAGSAVTDRDLATVVTSQRSCPLCALRTVRLDLVVRQGRLSSGDTPTPTFLRLAGLKSGSPCLCCQLLFTGVDSSCAVVPGLQRARVSSASLLPPRRPLGDVGVSPNREQV